MNTMNSYSYKDEKFAVIRHKIGWHRHFGLLFVWFYLLISSSILTLAPSVFVIQILLTVLTVPFILKRNYKFAKLYVIIFLVSICFVFLVYWSNQFAYGAPYYIGGSDDLIYEQRAMYISELNVYKPKRVVEIESGKIGTFYVIFLAWVMKFANVCGGYSTFIPRFINIYFLIWIVMIFESLLRKHTNISEDRLYYILAIFALTPNIQYINSHVFRDTLNLLQIFLIVYSLDEIIDKSHFKKIIYIIILVASVYTLLYTRPSSIIFPMLVILFIIFDNKKYKWISLITILVILLSVGVLQFVRLNDYINIYSKYLINQYVSSENITRLSKYIFILPLLPFGLLLRLFYGLITPFPSIFSLFRETSFILFDITRCLINCGVIVQILLIPFLFKRLFKLDWLSMSFLATYIGVIITTFTFRHYLIYYPFMSALFVDGFISTGGRSRKLITFLWLWTTIALFGIYVSLHCICKN